MKKKPGLLTTFKDNYLRAENINRDNLKDVKINHSNRQNE